MSPQKRMLDPRKGENGRGKLKKTVEISKSHNLGVEGQKNTPSSTGRSWDTGLHYGRVGRYLALVLPLCLLISQELFQNDPIRCKNTTKKAREPVNNELHEREQS